MQFSINKAKVTAIIVTILMVTSITMMTIPVNAQGTQAPTAQDITGTNGPLASGITPDATITTIPFLSISPYTLGMGQMVLFNMWMQPPLSVARALKGYSVTITKPDGTTDTVNTQSYPADSTSWFQYVVDQVGNWSAVFSFPGQYCPAGYYLAGRLVAYPNGTKLPAWVGLASIGTNNLTSTYYTPSASPKISFVVQSDLVASWPPTPLPTGYWTRPISPNFREWYQVSGSYPWAFANNYRFQGPYVTAPNTAHVMWRREGELGGLVGGDIAYRGGGGVQTSIYSGGGFGMDTDFPSMIFMGRCYQTITKPMLQLINGTTQMWPTSVWQCYDLRTGQIYWEQTGISQVPTKIMWEGATPEVEGAESDWRSAPSLVYIGATRLIKYNPYTGAATLNISTPLGGTPWGNEIVYAQQTLNATAGIYRLVTWNLTGSSTDFNTRIQSNMTWPFSTLGTCDFNAGVSVTTGTVSSAGTQILKTIMGASLTTGQLLWNVTSTLVNFEDTMSDNGYFAASTEPTREWAAWDLNTGKQAWISEQTAYPWGAFWAYSAESAYGNIYTQTYDGVYAISWTTVKIVWRFKAEATPFETPYTTGTENLYSFFGSGGVSVGDGKIFVFSNEHTPSQPMTRGWKMFALNATTGTNMWNITGYMTPGAFADGYLTAGSGYDGYMYVFGPGPSATTVTTPKTTVPVGSSVLIQGTVMDKSPGTMPPTTSPAGTNAIGQPEIACVSADSMGVYMENVYMQMPIPAGYTVTGVPVRLLAIDSNGTVIDIGTTTSDMSGAFQYSWTPPAEGVYKVTATFAGDQSYGSSWAETGLSVGPAPATPPPVDIPTPADPTMTIIGMGIAIIIAVAIFGALILMKKH